MVGDLIFLLFVAASYAATWDLGFRDNSFLLPYIERFTDRSLIVGAKGVGAVDRMVKNAKAALRHRSHLLSK